MAEFSGNGPANKIPHEMNFADYCDALNAERWSRLLDETKRAKRARSPSLMEEPAIKLDERAGAAGSR